MNDRPHPGPTFSDEQAFGNEAEDKFAALVSKRAWLFHPSRARNDFGLDGTVELRDDDRRLRGVEFRVQIKGRSHLEEVARRPGQLRLDYVRPETAAYWLARMTPTLIVGYSKASGQFYFEWAHHAISSSKLYRALRESTKVPVLLPVANVLDERGWECVEVYARAVYQASQDLMTGAAARASYDLLYRLVSDVADVYLELIAWLAYGSPELLAVRLTEREQINDEILERFRKAALRPPDRILEGGLMWPLWLSKSLQVVLSSFADTVQNSGGDADNPVAVSAQRVAGFLEAYVDRMRRDGPPVGTPTSDEEPKPRLSWAILDIPNAVTSIALISLLLRDFQRDMRRWLYPLPPEDIPILPMQIIRDLSDDLITPAPAWLGGGNKDGSEPSAEGGITEA